MDELLQEWDNIEASHEQLDNIEMMLKTATIDPEYSERISRTLNTLTYLEAEQMAKYLSERQVNPILAGHNYNQSDINNLKSKHIG